MRCKKPKMARAAVRARGRRMWQALLAIEIDCNEYVTVPTEPNAVAIYRWHRAASYK